MTDECKPKPKPTPKPVDPPVSTQDDDGSDVPGPPIKGGGKP